MSRCGGEGEVVRMRFVFLVGVSYRECLLGRVSWGWKVGFYFGFVGFEVLGA